MQHDLGRPIMGENVICEFQDFVFFLQMENADILLHVNNISEFEIDQISPNGSKI